MPQPIMTSLELRRLGDLRAHLDGFAARHAALCAADDPDVVQQLRLILPRLATAIRRRDYAAFRAADRELHHGIATLAAVPELPALWEHVWTAQAAFHQQTFEECFPDPRFLVQEHEHLVETIALGDPAAAEDAARSHVEAVWFRLADEADPKPAPDGGLDALLRAAAHLAFSLSRPLRLEDVAAEVAFTSPGHLSRLFRQHYGLSFQGYLQKLRLDKAAELLRTTRLPVSRIARRVGYNDVSRFGQHFKRHTGQTPRAWRKANHG